MGQFLAHFFRFLDSNYYFINIFDKMILNVNFYKKLYLNR